MAVHMEKKHRRDLIDAVIGLSLPHSMCTAGSKLGLTMGRVWGKMIDWIGGRGRLVARGSCTQGNDL